MSAPVPNRPDMALDLTRWNRAGLSRFDYLDGDASVWLEELKIALLGLYLRGGDGDLRTPELWRDVFTKDPLEWPSLAELNVAADLVAWKKLAPKAPPAKELRGQRNARLLDQYNAPRDDLSWEILRAFARASHVLLGHANAYANEGYLRTATQWDNLRRLAAMVNHQPTPQASATAQVALALKEGTGAIEIARSLAMKYTPPAGGAPLVFETLEAVDAHPDLNAARVVKWNENHTHMSFSEGGDVPKISWIAPKKAELSPGNLGVLTYGNAARAVIFDKVNHDPELEIADIAFDQAFSAKPKYWETHLHVEPDDVLTGLPRSGDDEIVLRTEGMASFAPGQVVKVLHNSTHSILVVNETANNLLRFKTQRKISGKVSVIQMAQISPSASGTDFKTADKIRTMYFAKDDNVYVSSNNKQNTGIGDLTLEDENKWPVRDSSNKLSFEKDLHNGVVIGHIFRSMGFRTKVGFVLSGELAPVDMTVKGGDPEVTSGVVVGDKRTVSFAGKPPKGLVAGDWFVSRDTSDDEVVALKVEGVRTSSDEYYLQFHSNVFSAPPRTEFHGPMKRVLRPEDFDFSPKKALTSTTVTLTGVSRDAQVLLKPGRPIILSRLEGGEPTENVNATIASAVSENDTQITVTMDFTDDLAHWAEGELALRMNCVAVSHGETKDGKILGSGDGERNVQFFDFAVSKVSHIPSTIAESGVAPDMDVTVDGIAWAYADFIDPSAEGSKSWSSVLSEDGHLRIYFRRRLPTGTNNVQVKRYRIGAGASGSGVPPYSFTKPMKKSPYVAGIYQPFETSGGADREPVSSLRESTPSRLAANGRAVSLTDFERLIRGHASVWRARAEEIATASAEREVLVTLVPANGAELTPKLTKDLRTSALSRALPGVRLNFAQFEELHLKMAATVRADLTSFERTELEVECDSVLRRTFALETMEFAQPVYRSEILAALETVVGVETAVVTGFDLWPSIDSPDTTIPRPKNVALRDAAVAAIYPGDNQVAFVPEPDNTGSSLIAIKVEGLV
ncbi:MAG: hypothetical protein GY947_10950 [Rhodobacteraceae bacterium]|nr:hypothetical protein [Paracoccaceae bacterium]